MPAFFRPSGILGFAAGLSILAVFPVIEFGLTVNNGGKAIQFVNPSQYARAADIEHTALLVEEDLRASPLLRRPLASIFTAVTIRLGAIPLLCRMPIAKPADAQINREACQRPVDGRDTLLIMMADSMLRQRMAKNI